MSRVFRGWSIEWRVLLAMATASPCFATGLETFDGCTLLPSSWADGDSFPVRLPDRREIVVRLYFVDCVEKDVADTTGKRRLREQARHFGVEDYAAAHRFGTEAAAFVENVLSQPFTVHTSFSRAPGRSASPRHYVFVDTAEGRDLGELLVENGLARAFGFGRETPDGTHRDDWEAHLKDTELAAALHRRGLWSHCEPNRLVEMRRQQREELRALESIDDALAPAPPAEPIDVNTASLEELVGVGLRESIADEVIKRRPIRDLAALDDVPGIGPATLRKVAPFLKFGGDISPPEPAP